MTFIYILKLEQEKYYVGKTENPEFRLDDHFESDGSAWTTKYRPIDVVSLIPNCSKYDEDKYTKIYMEKYGINNVRGGSFCQLDLTLTDYDVLLKMINGANDKCYICGMRGHFSNNCSDRKIQSNRLRNVKPKVTGNCFICGRAGHWANHCYATTDIYGNYIEFDSSESDDSDY